MGARELLRRTGIGLCSVALLLIVAGNTAGALNLYQDLFITLSARPLAMGGAAVAVPQPASVFYNPAALAPLRQLTVLWNHSARHFGYTDEGGYAERDQLDGDTEAIVVPLPLSVYAHGWTASGEMGYDYRNHPPDGSLGFPREFLWGTESYDALATSTSLPCAVGYAQRRSLHRFTPAPEDPAPLPWVRLGEGQQWGVYARVLPGLDYGYSELKQDYDWTLMTVGEAFMPPSPVRPALRPRVDARDESVPVEEGAINGSPTGIEFPTLSSRIKTTRSGYALRPVGWLTLAHDDVREDYRWRDADVWAGVLHNGDQSLLHRCSGGELKLGHLAAYRWGSRDGKPTEGLMLGIGNLQLNWTEAHELLPEIVGSGEHWRNMHIYGAELALW